MNNSLFKIIGNTPLVSICDDKKVYAKLEYFNPGGSIKDRSAWYLVEHAEKNGLLKPGYTIIDASSGNHGIALAMIGAIKGYPVIITSSEKTSLEKQRAMQAYGATVILCPPTDFIDDPQSYHSRAVALAREVPNSCMLNQYFNPVNAQAHYHLLGPEIYKQTDRAVTHFFAAAGTGGTISGAGAYLKEQNPHIKVIAVDAANSYRSTGGHPKPYKVEGMGIDFDSPVMRYDVIDQIIPVTDDQALLMLKKIAQSKGLLVGPSSGAVAHAVLEYTSNPDLFDPKKDCAVAIFGDSGRAYLTKNFYTQSPQDQELLLRNSACKLGDDVVIK